jgi:hypothetical protein
MDALINAPRMAIDLGVMDDLSEVGDRDVRKMVSSSFYGSYLLAGFGSCWTSFNKS